MCVEQIDRGRLAKLRPVEGVVALMAPGVRGKPNVTTVGTSARCDGPNIRPIPTIRESRLHLRSRREFIRRGDNLVLAGQSGVGKSHIVQAVGRAACALGYRVRYTTSAELLRDLTASLADHTLPQRLRYYSNFELLVIDEFGFDKIERAESSQAASLLYKVVDSRSPQRSTALVTNIGFEAWADYLGDAPLAMAILDRLVDGAIVLKIEGRSYRAHCSKPPATPPSAEAPNTKQRGRSTG